MKKDIIKVYFIQLLTIIVSFATSILISRILGAEGRGYFSLYQNSFNFAIILLGFSITSSIPYFINSLEVSSSKIFYTSTIINIIAVFLLMATLWGIDKFSLNELTFPDNSIFYKIIFVFYFLFQVIFNVNSAILNSYKKFTTTALLSFINLFVPILLYLGIFLNLIQIESNKNIQIVILALLISMIFTSTSSIIILFKNKYIDLKIALLNKIEIKKFLSYSTLAYISNIATFLCYKFDFWIVDSYHGKSALGIYSLSSQLAQMLWILPQIMASVLYTYAAAAPKQEAIEITAKVTKIAMYITFVFASIGILLSGPIIPILYGESFKDVTLLLAIQIIGTIPFCIPTVIASFYASQGNFKVSFWISIIVTVLAIIMYYLLIPKYGTIGGSIASATTYFLGGVISLFYFCRRYNVNIKDVIWMKKEDFTTFIKMIKK